MLIKCTKILCEALRKAKNKIAAKKTPKISNAWPGLKCASEQAGGGAERERKRERDGQSIQIGDSER